MNAETEPKNDDNPINPGGRTDAPCSGDWDVERTHGRLCKVQYDVGCTEADQYCDQLRKEGWKAWSLSSDGKRVTEVFYLRYTNTAHERHLPSQNDLAQPTPKTKTKSKQNED